MTDTTAERREDIVFFTKLLHDDPRYEALRETLRVHGFDPARLLLVDYQEDEEENEYGVLLAEDGSVYDFSHSTQGNRANPESFHCQKIENKQTFIQEVPALSVALEMLQEQTVAGA